MMQVRNDHNLTWWAICNAAATFTDKEKNISVYFGISTSQRTMKEKLKKMVPNHVILKRTSDELAGYKFGITFLTTHRCSQS